MENTYSEFIIFKTQDEKISVYVRLKEETVWLTQDQMAMLFNKTKSTISEHIKHVFEENELDENSVVRKFRTTAADGKNYDVNYFNLDVIISVGYRVKSLRGTQFRQWATKRLNEYIRKGFTMDDERLKNLGGGGYWKELLQRIRDIRASEKVFYRQVLDIYATSIDYAFDTVEKLNTIVFRTLGSSLEHSIGVKFDYDIAQQSLRFYRHQDIDKIEKIHIPNNVSEVKYKSDLSRINPINFEALTNKQKLFNSL